LRVNYFFGRLLDVKTEALNELLHDSRVTTFGKMIETQARLERIFGVRLETECGISHSWFEILLRVGRSPDRRLKMSELANQVALTTGGITRVMDRMVEGGFLERVADPKDRRVQYAQLTSHGIEKLNAGLSVHVVDLQTELFDRLTTKQVEAFEQILEVLRYQ
jgi:MarR family transcriptional regulator, 2-MHQ and catechol-resistance regulon repressor